MVTVCIGPETAEAQAGKRAKRGNVKKWDSLFMKYPRENAKRGFKRRFKRAESFALLNYRKAPALTMKPAGLFHNGMVRPLLWLYLLAA